MAIEIFIPKDNPQYRLTSDAYSFIVEGKHIVDPTKGVNWKKREAEGANPSPRVTWSDPKYYPTLEQALNSLPNRMARDSDAETMDDLLNELREFRREISDLLCV